MNTTPLSCFQITGTRITGFLGDGRPALRSTDKGNFDVVIPDGITEIGRCAFNNREHPAADNIRSVVIPDSVTKIATYAFFATNKLERVTLPAGLRVLNDGVLKWNPWLVSVNLPETLQTIGDEVFSCTGLREVVVPEGVTSIGFMAFSSCRHLEKIVLSPNVRQIGKHAFTYSEKVTIHTTPGSYAEQYAREHNIPVAYISQAETEQHRGAPAVADLQVPVRGAAQEYPFRGGDGDMSFAEMAAEISTAIDAMNDPAQVDEILAMIDALGDSTE